MEKVDSVVIGAGVVGLAIARELARRGQEVLVLEADDDIGTGISSRNSEVVHAGIYYPQGSLKARFCVAGRHALNRYCADRGVALKTCGKLIVGSDDDVPTLERLLSSGLANGVDDLRLISRAQALAMEPALKCDVALYSPSTGIVDSHAVMLAFIGDVEATGGMIVTRTPVLGGRADADGIVLETGGDENLALHAQRVVNAAGLGAVDVANRIDGVDNAPTLSLAKGNYFDLRGQAPFQHLIYPAPVPGGLGIHLTLDQSGRARFGPDVEWIDELNYDVDLTRADSFYAAIRRYWPDLPDNSLYSAYAGVRPKITRQGEPAADFRIDYPRDHGIAGLVNLYGIESPGLTSSMAIGRAVADALDSPKR
ncbi:MAG: NAD(P)/FAD-dependent oxidoreductase [Gammaproteobacteria bacterium]